MNSGQTQLKKKKIVDKLHERKMNDSYKSPNGKCLEKFKFVKKVRIS